MGAFGLFFENAMKKIIFALFFIAQFALAEISTPITGVLDNGFRYAILPLHDDKGRLEIRLKVHAGGMDENDGQAGVAHMVEHLVFRASERYPDGVMNYLHGTGWVRGKHYNAITTPDSTTYMMTLPNHATLDDGLGVLSQMMFFAKMNESDLDQERHIILEEWRGNLGVSAVMDSQRKAVIRAGSRHTTPLIGTQESISTMPAHELQNFYQIWYTPNNMHLLIVGDIKPDTAKVAINEYFGQVPNMPLPERPHDYYEPVLTDQLIVAKLGDERSGVSQVAYILRFDDSASRGTSPFAVRHRLLDRLTLNFITKRLQNEMPNLPAGVRSLVVRKSDIGKHTTALGFFSSIEKHKHKDGLGVIFDEIERLRRYPISQDEFDEIKEVLQAQLDKAHNHNEDRDFAGWVLTMTNTVLSDIPYQTQRQIASNTQPILDALTPDDIYAHVQKWLNAKDRIVQYQSANNTPTTPITNADIAKLQQLAIEQTLPPPTPKKSDRPIELPSPITTAHISAITHQKDTGVYEYVLSTGEKVIYLQSLITKGKTYIRAINHAGIQADNLNAWQSQFAVQLLAQNTPDGILPHDFENFKKRHKLYLSPKQSEKFLTIEGSSDTANFGKLIDLYHAQLFHTTITHGLNDVKTAYRQRYAPTNHRKQLEHERHLAIAHLRGLPSHLPDEDELDRLNEQDLQKLWERIRKAPMTIYIISDATPTQMGQFVPLFASPHANDGKFLHHAHPPTPNTDTVKFAYNLEPRVDVQLWSGMSHTWRGIDAMQVSLLKTIASEKLKFALRDDKLGIYRLHFDTTLNPQTNQITSHLRFSTSPDKVDEMVEVAKDVLVNLSSRIDDDDVARAKQTFIAQEKSRQNDPHTKLNRLVLSYENGDLDYLKTSKNLADFINLDDLKRMASKIYDPNNVQTFIDMPLTKE